MTLMRAFKQNWFLLLLGISLLPITIFASQSPSNKSVTRQLKSSVAPSFSVLLFTKTAAFRHSSIVDGIAAITALGEAHHFEVVASEDTAVFTDTILGKHQVIVFLNTTGNILDGAEQAAMERFIQNGGGFVGIHSATDTEYDWAWYGQLVGNYFANHPPIQSATVQIVEANHPSTQPLPQEWIRTDEWYNFQTLPDPTISILAVVDESTYAGGTMGSPHPIVWAHEFDGGRAWYTAMGHTAESYNDPLFRQHLWGGIRWAANHPYILYLPLLQQ